jgi:hypothetical protein
MLLTRSINTLDRMKSLMRWQDYFKDMLMKADQPNKSRLTSKEV